MICNSLCLLIGVLVVVVSCVVKLILIPQRPTPYVFNYGVQSDNSNFGQEEEGDGQNVRGSYYVQLPDGRLQKVDYWADESGYHATVSYEGTASYPTVSYSSSPSGYGY